MYLATKFVKESGRSLIGIKNIMQSLAEIKSGKQQKKNRQGSRPSVWNFNPENLRVGNRSTAHFTITFSGLDVYSHNTCAKF
jgi:hypothetical protein